MKSKVNRTPCGDFFRFVSFRNPVKIFLAWKLKCLEVNLLNKYAIFAKCIVCSIGGRRCWKVSAATEQLILKSCGLSFGPLICHSISGTVWNEKKFSTKAKRCSLSFPQRATFFCLKIFNTRKLHYRPSFTFTRASCTAERRRAEIFRYRIADWQEAGFLVVLYYYQINS